MDKIFCEPDSNFPYAATTVPFIWVSMSGEMDWATRAKDKLELLKKAQNGEQGIVIAVWPGQWSSDVFELDMKTAYDEISRHLLR